MAVRCSAWHGYNLSAPFLEQEVMEGSAGEGKPGLSQAPWSEKGPRVEDPRGVEVPGGRNQSVEIDPVPAGTEGLQQLTCPGPPCLLGRSQQPLRSS